MYMIPVKEDEKYYCDFEDNADKVRVEVVKLAKGRDTAEVELLEGCSIGNKGETVWVEEEELYRE